MEKFINKRLADKGIRLSEVARRMGVSRQSLGESVTKDLRISTMLRIAEAMGMQLCLYDSAEKKIYRITEQDIKN